MQAGLAGRWALVVLILIGIVWIGWAQTRISSLSTQLGECRGTIDAVADTAAGNATALLSCRDLLNAEIDERRAAEGARDRANEQLEIETEQRRALAEREREARARAGADLCGEWVGLPVCPDIADSLRRAAEDHHED